MRKLSDYVFYDSWQLNELCLIPGETYLITMDFCDLQQGTRVRFVGFDDIDNHHGVFVFTGSDGAILEARGDFSGLHGHLLALKQALHTMINCTRCE